MQACVNADPSSFAPLVEPRKKPYRAVTPNRALKKSYLIVLLIFYFQHNHCISQKYQRYLKCSRKSIIGGAESIKLVRLENEQKKNSPHYYKLSSKTKLHICLNYIDSIIKQVLLSTLSLTSDRHTHLQIFCICLKSIIHGSLFWLIFPIPADNLIHGNLE